MASSAEKNQRIVGLVFFGAMALLFAYTVLLTGVFKGKTKRFFVSFPKIYGLKEGDRVRAEGLDVGEVKELRLVERPDGKMRINAMLQVKKNVEVYREASEVKVTPFSPLGGRVIEIQRGYESPKGKFASVEEAESQGLSIDATDDTKKLKPIEGVAEGELLSTLNEIVETNKEKVNHIVSNLEVVSTNLANPDGGVVGKLINDPGAAVKMDEITNQMKESVESLNDILARLRKGEGVLGELTVKNSQLHDDVGAMATAARGTLEEAHKILERANRGESALGVLVADESAGGAAADMKSIAHDFAGLTKDVQAGQGTVGKLFKDDRLYNGAAKTAENLGVITDNLREKRGAVGVLLNDEEAGHMVKSTLDRLEKISRSIDEKEGALGLVVKDKPFRDTVAKIFTEVQRTVVEFRDSVEDLREQAPVNAFLGTVFAAF